MTGHQQRVLKRIGALVVIVASIVVTILQHPDLPKGGGAIGWFVLVFAVANVILIVTWIAIAVSVAHHAHRNRPESLWTQIRSLGSMKDWSLDTLSGVADDRLFHLIFTTNAIAALVGAVVPAVAIVWLLPPSGWGLLTIPALDTTASMLLRRSIHRRVEAARRANAAEAQRLASAS